jgi:hypothetical protein
MVDKFHSNAQKSNFLQYIPLPARIMMPRGPHQEGGIEMREVKSATPAKVRKKFQWTPYSPTCSCADTKAKRTSPLHTPTDLPHPNWHSLSPGSQHSSSQPAAQIPGAARGFFSVEHLHTSCNKVGHPTAQKVHFTESLILTQKTSVTSLKTYKSPIFHMTRIQCPLSTARHSSIQVI